MCFSNKEIFRREMFSIANLRALLPLEILVVHGIMSKTKLATQPISTLAVCFNKRRTGRLI